jgi:acetyl esterase
VKSAKVPGLILFHGGGWSGGTLSQFRSFCAYMATRGLVCATAEYQMLSAAESAKLPAGVSKKRVCITDAKSAIRWFKQQAKEFGMDADRIITGGGSAGAHLSALATLNPGLSDPKDNQEVSLEVVAYLWFNPAFAVNDHQDAEVDILKHLKAAQPPTLVFFGTDDKQWLEGWNVAYAKWKSLGTTSINYQMAPGQKHGFFNQPPWQVVTWIAADQFLVKLGLISGKPTLAAPATGIELKPAPNP